MKDSNKMHKGMEPVNLLIQEEVSRGLEMPRSLRDGGRILLSFQGADPGWRDHLAMVEDAWGPMGIEPGKRVACFVSLQAARLIRKDLSWLRRGLFLDEENLHVHRFSGILPQDMLLNRSFVLLPVGALSKRRDQLAGLFGEKLFIRPDSPMKPFAGSPVGIDEIDLMVATWKQANAIHDDLLVAVDRHREISRTEFRFWLADGGIITCAPYSHEGTVSARPTAAMRKLALQAAQRLEPFVNPVVADFVEDENGDPRLVELNAPSTSGFYPGMDIEALAAMMDRMIA